MLRATAAIVFMCVYASPANSRAFDCEQVRAYVAQHGKAAAIAYALKHGATWREINEGRKCLSQR